MARLVAVREDAGQRRKEAIAEVAAELGVPKREVFDAVVAAKNAEEAEDEETRKARRNRPWRCRGPGARLPQARGRPATGPPPARGPARPRTVVGPSSIRTLDKPVQARPGVRIP